MRVSKGGKQLTRKRGVVWERGHTFPQPLVFPADKDGGQAVAGDEQQEEDVMQAVMAQRVEDGEQDQAGGADDGEGDGQPGEDLLARGAIRHQTAFVTEPPVRAEGQIQEHGRQHAARNEQRLQVVRRDVADVGDVLVFGHGGIVLAPRVHVPVYQQAQQRRQPYYTRYYGENLVQNG